MPGVYDYNSVNDAWRNGSVMDMVNNQVAQQQPTDADAFTRQANLYANIPVDYTGNINLANRPTVQNPDGSVSTVRSMSFNEDGKEVLVPTVSQDGRNLTPQQAIDAYRATGQHLGKFDTPEAATEMARRIHDQQAYGVNNSVFNQTHRAENPQPVPTQPATQVASQGMGRRPTLQDYQAFALDYLAKKGYDYDEAMELMRPEFQAFAVREQAQNQALADDLVGRMQTMDIASPEYRQAAFQLYRLDPKMGQFMLKEGIGPRELYLQNQKREDAATARQQKKEDMLFNADLQIENKLRWLKAQDAYTQQRYANMAQQYINAGYSPKEAWAFAMGGSRGKGATVGGGVSAADYKRATEGLKALMQKIDEKRLEDPSYQLSPEEQQQYNWLYAIKQKGDNEFYARNGINTQQQQQRAKLNPNDYYSFGPVLQDMVRMNGGMSKDVARAMRAALGFDPDDNSPNNFVNQVMKDQYGFSG